MSALDPCGLPVLHFERPDTWPSALTSPGWVTEEALRAYALRGWHCTRLMDHEIAAIERDGLVPQTAESLRQRVHAAVEQGCLPRSIAHAILSRHLADEPWRTGTLWFTFTPPASTHALVYRLFRFWGGESAYGPLEETGEAEPLQTIGTPCVVEASVPLAWLTSYYLAEKMNERYWKWRDGTGEAESECSASISARHEGFITATLPPCVVRVHRSPSPAFVALAGEDAGT